MQIQIGLTPELIILLHYNLLPVWSNVFEYQLLFQSWTAQQKNTCNWQNVDGVSITVPKSVPKVQRLVQHPQEKSLVKSD